MRSPRSWCLCRMENAHFLSANFAAIISCAHRQIRWCGSFVKRYNHQSFQFSESHKCVFDVCLWCGHVFVIKLLIYSASLCRAAMTLLMTIQITVTTLFHQTSYCCSNCDLFWRLSTNGIDIIFGNKAETSRYFVRLSLWISVRWNIALIPLLPFALKCFQLYFEFLELILVQHGKFSVLLCCCKYHFLQSTKSSKTHRCATPISLWWYLERNDLDNRDANSFAQRE